jgi:two-component system nitrate/nitrite response regulator NarL
MLGETAARTDRERFDDLSRRELEVLEMASRGLTNPQMASNLSVTVYAIKFHLTSIYRKLGVANRTEAAVAFLTARGDNGDRPEPH